MGQSLPTRDNKPRTRVVHPQIRSFLGQHTTAVATVAVVRNDYTGSRRVILHTRDHAGAVPTHGGFWHSADDGTDAAARHPGGVGVRPLVAEGRVKDGEIPARKCHGHPYGPCAGGCPHGRSKRAITDERRRPVTTGPDARTRRSRGYSTVARGGTPRRRMVRATRVRRID